MCVLFFFDFFFFFQAEDGIRYLVRSRGLGDVYKRQTQPTIGTGTIGYLQAGFVLPKLKNGTFFMPYLTATYKDFQRLKDPSFQWGLGLNYHITGHNAKIALEYATRPVYKESGQDILLDGTRGQFILQSQIFL